MGQPVQRIGVLPFLFPYLVALTLPVGLQLGGFWCYSTGLFLFLIHPVIDRLGGDERIQTFLPVGKRAHFYILWGYVPLQIGLLIWALSYFANPARTVIERIGIVYSVFVLNGSVGMAIAHELVHRRSRFERALSVMLLACINYLPFRLAHVFWHHRYIATVRDPSSAPEGISLYQFLLSSVPGNYRVAWQLEQVRLDRRGHAARFWENRMFQYGCVSLALIVLSALLFGYWGLVLFVSQGILASMLVETINYIEHYGLHRAISPQGKPDPVGPQHAWDTSRRFTNWFSLNLGHHAHHHMHPSVPYPELLIFEQSPKLPAGYSTMVLLAMVPPLWRRAMHPVLREFKKAEEKRERDPSGSHRSAGT